MAADRSWILTGVGNHSDRPDLTTAIAADLVPLRGVVRRRSAEVSEEAELWPALVVVVSEPVDAEHGSAAALYDLLNRPDDLAGSSVLSRRCEWTVVDPVLAMVGLTVRSAAPVGFAIRVLVPAGRVLPVLEVAAEGGMLAITTRSRAARMTIGDGLGRLLRDVLLVPCPASPELAALARELHCTRQPTVL